MDYKNFYIASSSVSNEKKLDILSSEKISYESLHASWVRNGYLSANVGTTIFLVGLTLRTTIGESLFTRILSISTLFIGLVIAGSGVVYSSLSSKDFNDKLIAYEKGIPPPKPITRQWVYVMGILQSIFIACLVFILILITINDGFD